MIRNSVKRKSINFKKAQFDPNDTPEMIEMKKQLLHEMEHLELAQELLVNVEEELITLKDKYAKVQKQVKKIQTEKINKMDKVDKEYFEKAAKIKELEEKIAERAKNLPILIEDIKIRTKEVEDLKGDLKAKSEEVLKIKAKGDAAKKNEFQLRIQLAQDYMKIHDLKQEIKDAEAVIAVQMKEKDLKLQYHENRIKAADKEIDHLKRAIEEKEKKKEEELKKLQDEIKEAEGHRSLIQEALKDNLLLGKLEMKLQEISVIYQVEMPVYRTQKSISSGVAMIKKIEPKDAPAVGGTETTTANSNSQGNSTLLPPPNLLGEKKDGGNTLPPPNLLGTTSGGSTLPPPNLLGTGSNLPPPNLLGGGSTLPPPNLLGNGGSNLPPPNLLGGGSTLSPPNLLGNGGSTLPPPNLLGSGGSNLPPPNLLGSGGSNLPPPNLLGSGSNLPPPNLLGSGGSNLPPPNLLGGSSTLPPPNLLGGNKSGGLPPPNLLGGGGSGGLPPPNLLGGGGSTGGLPPPNLLGGGGGSGGLPPPNLMGKPGGLPPPNMLGGPPNLLGGPPNLLGGPPKGAVQKKPKVKPNCPMKSLNWTVVDNPKGTVWEKIDDTGIKLDLGFLEKEFSMKKDIKVQAAQPKEEKPQKISLLDPNRSKNVELVLGKLKMPPDIIAKALITFNEGVLTKQMVESLINILPNETEYNTVKGYEDQKDQLAAPELLFLEIGKVNGYTQRVQALHFKYNYDWLLNDYVYKVDKFLEITKRCKSDDNLITILKYALAIGNYMNGQSARGGAYGFKLESLQKMAEVKSQDNKQLLLTYVLDYAEKKTGIDLVEVGMDLSDFTEIGVKVPLSQLQIDLAELKKNARNVTSALTKQTDNKEDRVKIALTDFNKKVNDTLGGLESKQKYCEAEYEELCKFFCENPKDCPSDKLFEKFFKVYNALVNSKKEIEKQKEAAAKKK